MLITHLNKRYPPHIGGVERVAHSLATLMAGDGHRVRAIACAPTRTSRVRELDGVEVIECPSYGVLQSVPIAPAYLWFGTRDGEIWHLHEPFPLGTVAVALRILVRRGHPLVVTWHSDVLRQRAMRPIHRAVADRVLAHAAVIHVPTEAHLARSQVLARHRAKVRVVPFPIDGRAYRQVGTSPLAQRIREWAAGHPVGLFLGRFVYYKGLDVLIDAAARVPGLRLVVAGDGPLARQLRDHASTAGLDGRVLWTGQVEESDLAGLYAGVDFFVLPSTHATEAFGLVQVEAMAAGLPVVSTRLGTGVDIVNVDGESGILVRPADVGELAAALETLARDTTTRDRLARGARDRADEFTPARLLPAYRDLYERASIA